MTGVQTCALPIYSCLRNTHNFFNYMAPPPLKWSQNNNALQWTLLGEVEKEENRRVLLGKRSKQDKTSGDTKDKVYQRMGEAMFPGLGSEMKSRIKGQWEKMVGIYQTHRARLRVTGGGLQPEDDSGAEASCYVHSSGPDDSTPEFAQNLWQQICSEWPFFPRFHQHLGSRPNVSPVVITTAIGPAGQETVWMQPCRSAPQPATAPTTNAPAAPAPGTPSCTPPTLLEPTAATAACSTPLSGRGFAVDVTNTVATPSPLARSQSAPNAGTRQVAAAIQSASSGTAKRPRSVAEVVVAVAEQTLSSLRKKTLQDNLLASRTALLAEFTAQIWTKEEFKKRIRKLENNHRLALQELEGGTDAGEARSSKRTRHSSPDWDSDLALSSSSDEADS